MPRQAEGQKGTYLFNKPDTTERLSIVDDNKEHHQCRHDPEVRIEQPFTYEVGQFFGGFPRNGQDNAS